MTAVPTLTTAPSEAPIDTTPISPTETAESLARRLAHRPDAQDLKNRGILFDTNAAPAIQQAQHELERQRAADALKKGLEKRADKEDLVERNVSPCYPFQ
jgi:hypothetical protein